MDYNILNYNNALTAYKAGNQQGLNQSLQGAPSSVINAFYPQKSAVVSAPTPAQSQQSKPIQPSQPAQPDLSSLYDPIFSGISNQENQQNQNFNSTLSSINAQGQQLAGDLDLQNTQQQNLTNNQTQSLQGEKQSAYEQAAQSYARASQNALNQYGETTGPIRNTPYDAIDSQAAQEMRLNQGNIGQSYMKALSDVLTQQQNVFAYTAQKKADLNQWVQEQTNAAKTTLTDNLAQLENTRFATQQDKARMQAQYAEDALQQYRNIQLQAYQSQLALQNWHEQFQTQLSSNLQGLRAQAVNYATNNPFASFKNNLTATTPTDAVDSLSPAGFQPKNNNDPFAQLTSVGQ